MPAKAFATQEYSFSEREAMNISDQNHCLEPSSQAKYACGVRRFVAFCKSQNIQDVVPSEISLAHFVSVVGREVKPGTMKTYLTGVVRHYKEKFPEVTTIRSGDKIKNSLTGHCVKVTVRGFEGSRMIITRVALKRQHLPPPDEKVSRWKE
ncbi:uncharacterized protein MELLADRAFT_113584 [Melampsora larici-populina 98AG31]|uniref:Uncharacterized protein n=1 Tax=Melampsora larici-populina (strain 98AG31 / pathotype 3-4-7) TaxID=747676 RepID=F4SAD9_MELLP|nr:uncharacterized protein MELLADRAFT_113584 [Melampsora larici-populina 98AG31]EGF98393.1 hypothetical protein MELLADRAFT_113584 [Melampsora larici-populina 98AG31]